MNNIDIEIEKLRMKKVEMANRINLAKDFDEKEELQLQISRIQQQIETLEKFKKK